MSLEFPQVFISSTGEFAAERRALEKRIREDEELGVVPYSYDVERPPGTSPLTEVARRLRQSELVILVIGSRFGTPFPESRGIGAWMRRIFRGPSPPKSIVQWEYEYAKKLRRPLHPYVKQFPNGTEIEELQEKFRGQITHFERGTWSILFDTAEQFVDRSYRDLRKWRLDFWELYRSLRGRRGSWTRGILLSLTVMVSLSLVTVAVAAMRTSVPRDTLLIVCGALVAMLFILGFLLTRSGDLT